MLVQDLIGEGDQVVARLRVVGKYSSAGTGRPSADRPRPWPVRDGGIGPQVLIAGYTVRRMRTKGLAQSRWETPSAGYAPERRAGFSGALRSELTKIRTLRSTYWTLVGLFVVTVFIGVLTCAVTGPAQLGPGYDPAYISLEGLALGQLVIAVLGVLTITSEYSTGMIRTSLIVQPRRPTVFAAKAAALALVAFTTGLASSLVSFLIGQAILNKRAAGTSLDQPHVLRAVIGGGLFLTVSALLALGLGAAIRYTAGAITAAITVLFMSLILEAFLPGTVQVAVDKWIPLNAGSQIWSTAGEPGAHQFSPWAGFAVFTAYAAAALGVGLAMFLRRDA
ncbi:MAG TPA: ABC transporter permease [Streptosporangiaceae bacterium]